MIRNEWHITTDLGNWVTPDTGQLDFLLRSDHRQRGTARAECVGSYLRPHAHRWRPQAAHEHKPLHWTNSSVPRGRPVCVHCRIEANSVSVSPAARYSRQLALVQIRSSPKLQVKFSRVSFPFIPEFAPPSVDLLHLKFHEEQIVGGYFICHETPTPGVIIWGGVPVKPKRMS